MTKRLTAAEKAALLEERQRRKAESRPFSIETSTMEGSPQRAFLASQAQYAIALCSKRAGKSAACVRNLALTAMEGQGVTALYLGLVQEAVENAIVHKLWEPLVKKYALPFEPVDSKGIARCTTTNSVVRFGSVDDVRHMATYMGDELAGGLVIIDECQNIPFGVLRFAVEETIMPSLSSTTEEHPIPGRLRLIGTVPETPHGYFYAKYVEENGWEKHGWNRFQNPYLRNQEAALAKDLTLLGLTVNDPYIRRLWFGDVNSFDQNATAYRYQASRSTYVPTAWEAVELGPFHCHFAPKLDCDCIILGIDPAQKRDRFAMTVFGFNRAKKQLWHLGECVSDAGADPMESQWLEVVAYVKSRYGQLNKVVRDPGSSSPTNDMLQHSHGIIVESAIKGPGSLKARVDLFADLLFRGICRVVEGSALDADLQACRWDEDALVKGQFKFNKVAGSPDIADSGSYIVPFFTELGKARQKVIYNSADEYWKAQVDAEIHRLYTEQDAKPKRAKFYDRIRQ